MNFFEFRQSRGEQADAEAEAIAHDVIGAAIEVHRHLGPGLPEKIYQAALEVELTLRGIEFQAQSPVPVSYKGVIVGEGKLDLLVGAKVIVELKSVDKLGDAHRAQLVSYLCASNLCLGLLINFNVSFLKHGIKRVLQDRPS